MDLASETLGRFKFVLGLELLEIPKDHHRIASVGEHHSAVNFKQAGALVNGTRLDQLTVKCGVW